MKHLADLRSASVPPLKPLMAAVSSTLTQLSSGALIHGALIAAPLPSKLAVVKYSPDKMRSVHEWGGGLVPSGQWCVCPEIRLFGGRAGGWRALVSALLAHVYVQARLVAMTSFKTHLAAIKSNNRS